MRKMKNDRDPKVSLLQQSTFVIKYIRKFYIVNFGKSYITQLRIVESVGCESIGNGQLPIEAIRIRSMETMIMPSLHEDTIFENIS